MSTIVIGGGWSGLSAAVNLSQNGHEVTVVEAAKQLGGRARSVQWQNLTIDNGQHLMIGAYRTMLNLLDVVGIEKADVFNIQPLNISIYDTDYPTLKLVDGHSQLPWSISIAWNFIKHNGMAFFIDVVRLQKDLSTCLRRPDQNVAQWLSHCQQSTRSIRQLWEPLCLATLNTPLSEASTHIFAKVVSEIFKSRAGAKLLIPRTSLGDVFPTHAAMYISENKGHIFLQTRVKKILINDDKVSGILTDKDEELRADNIVLATSPAHARKLLPLQNVFSTIDYPITTLYLKYTTPIELPSNILGFSGCHTQWLFDRQDITPGLLSVVISGPGEHQSMTNATLVEKVLQEIQSHFPTIAPPLIDFKVIREKRATFNCHQGIQTMRPITKTEVNGLWLAGDYIASPYPATIESAMMSGQQAAHAILNHDSK